MSVEQEKQVWDAYFQEALLGANQESDMDESLWWNLCERDSIRLIASLFTGRPPISVLEAGCGSGATSFRLSQSVPVHSLTLFDISANALSYAKTLESKGRAATVAYAEGDVFRLSSLKQNFDLVWNVGLVEHYQPEEIELIVQEMVGATASGGWTVVAIPNRNSIAVKKAAFLGSPFGRKVLPRAKGYRNTTEILYKNSDLRELLERASGRPVSVFYAGSPLWVGAPTPLVRWVERLSLLRRLSFLTFFAIRKS